MFGNRRSLILGTAQACLLGALFACAPAPPQEVGVAGDGNLQVVLEEIRAEAGLPALAGMLIVGDEVMEIAATGVRAKGDSTPVTVDDKWHIGSNTKAMTATLAGIFVERGLIEWSTTIDDVFPELRGQIRPEFVDVRLDELLSHTAGVSNNVRETHFWETSWETEAPIMEQRAAWVPQLLSLEPDAPRGDFAYSNSGFVVVGAMLERLAGESWETLMQRELFQPLGMGSAGFGPPGDPEAAADQPRGHQGLGNSGRPVYADNPPSLGPAGTVHVSLFEHARFLIAHMRGAQGEDGIVSAETFEKLHTPFPESSYALGWGVAEREWARGSTLTHSGSNTMWFHTVWIAPQRNIAIVASTNIAGGTAPGAVDRAVGAILARFEASGGSEGEQLPNDPAVGEQSGRLDQGKSVWEHARLSGVDFRGTGNEPGWYVEIRDDLEARSGKRIRFVFDYGQQDAVLHAFEPEIDPGFKRTVYHGENGDLQIVVSIEGKPCSDTMSDERFESTVTVEFQGRTYRGCGRVLR